MANIKCSSWMDGWMDECIFGLIWSFGKILIYITCDCTGVSNKILYPFNETFNFNKIYTVNDSLLIFVPWIQTMTLKRYHHVSQPWLLTSWVQTRRWINSHHLSQAQPIEIFSHLLPLRWSLSCTSAGDQAAHISPWASLDHCKTKTLHYTTECRAVI